MSLEVDLSEVAPDEVGVWGLEAKGVLLPETMTWSSSSWMPREDWEVVRGTNRSNASNFRRTFPSVEDFCDITRET